MLVQTAHFCVVAFGAEPLRGVDRKQHGLALADIGAEALAAELDEPDILLAHDEIADAWPVGNECRRLRGLAEPKSQHGAPRVSASLSSRLGRQGRGLIAPHNAPGPRLVPSVAAYLFPSIAA